MNTETMIQKMIAIEWIISDSSQNFILDVVTLTLNTNRLQKNKISEKLLEDSLSLKKSSNF